ncbi:MAG TPA: helix-turn-helix domain-containing protein [Isosphaeraceae bacterium]|jgi:putative transcriptional regulator|nr:helix-turn-helix domain-containing protein [Isosphaeraceae bacterium]
MSDRPQRLPVFEQIRKGLEEAILHARGDITLKTTVVEIPDPPPDVRPDELTAQRIERGMSPTMFARLLNVSVGTVQAWERGDRKPSGAVLRLIQVLRHHPRDVLAVAGMSESPTAAAVASKSSPVERGATTQPR